MALCARRGSFEQIRRWNTNGRGCNVILRPEQLSAAEVLPYGLQASIQSPRAEESYEGAFDAAI